MPISPIQAADRFAVTLDDCWRANPAIDIEDGLTRCVELLGGLADDGVQGALRRHLEWAGMNFAASMRGEVGVGIGGRQPSQWEIDYACGLTATEWLEAACRIMSEVSA